MTVYDLDKEKWARVAAEFRRLANLSALPWVRAELLRSASFYENLNTDFAGKPAVTQGLTTSHTVP